MSNMQTRATIAGLQSHNILSLAMLALYILPIRATSRDEDAECYRYRTESYSLEKGKDNVDIIGWCDTMKKYVDEAAKPDGKTLAPQILLINNLKVVSYVGIAEFFSVTGSHEEKSCFKPGIDNGHWEIMLKCKYNNKKEEVDCLVNVDFGPKSKDFTDYAFEKEGKFNIQIIKMKELDEKIQDDLFLKKFVAVSTGTPMIPSRKFYTELKKKFTTQKVSRPFVLSKLVNAIRGTVYSGLANTNPLANVQNCQTMVKIIKQYCVGDAKIRKSIIKTFTKPGKWRKVGRWILSGLTYFTNFASLGIVPWLRSAKATTWKVGGLGGLEDWILSKEDYLMDSHGIVDTDDVQSPESKNDTSTGTGNEQCRDYDDDNVAIMIDPKPDYSRKSGTSILGNKSRRRLVILEQIIEL